MRRDLAGISAAVAATATVAAKPEPIDERSTLAAILAELRLVRALLERQAQATPSPDPDEPDQHLEALRREQREFSRRIIEDPPHRGQDQEAAGSSRRDGA